jgi:KipI family sensor histidine kinase inhibitor
VTAAEWPRFRPVGESAALVQFGNAIDAGINARVHRLADLLARADWQGFGEAVPAYASLLVHYDPLLWAYSDVVARIESCLPRLPLAEVSTTARLVEIPVIYGGDDGPDLEAVARAHDLTPRAVIQLHSQAEYGVYMIGFTPGFPYLGGLDERIATPRRESPRTLVPAGSVGIAGQQTGIYPLASPGGWQIIGRTALDLFDPARVPPSLLAPGDRVRFVPVEPGP